MRIIYKNGGGGISIIHPTEEALAFMSIKEIAEKDVPTGVAFKIVPDSEILADRTFRDAWTIDDSELTDGFGADYGSGSKNILLGYDENRNPIIQSKEGSGL